MVTQAEGDNLTAWAWWAVPETPIQGAGLIKVGPSGVLSERLTFYTKLPEGGCPFNHILSPGSTAIRNSGRRLRCQ